MTCGDLVPRRDYEFVNLVSNESMWIMIVVLHFTLHQGMSTSYLTLLLVVVHIINISAIVALNTKVVDKIWFYLLF